jgi:aldose 1-epimerase
MNRIKRGPQDAWRNSSFVIAAFAVMAFAAAGGAEAGSVSKAPFGKTKDGVAVDEYTLTNDKGASVKFISYGGIITEINVPDRWGRIGSVVLGFKTVGEYEAKSPYFGAIIGRYANRIAAGKFSIDGTEYTLPLNNGKNTLHGGDKGFDKNVWTVEELPSIPEAAAAKLTLVSKDGDQGYPGTLTATVTYTFNNKNELTIAYEATTDKPTVVNLTSHSYFNLAGDGSGSIYDQILTINADKFTPVDGGGIPTGEIADVTGTPFDFRQGTPIGARIRSSDEQMVNGRGYDHNWVINGTGGGMTMDARAYDPATGRSLEIWSDQPGLQFYTGNFLDSTTVGAAGKQYRQGDAYCLETQHFPDSPNHPDFPSTRLKPGETYKTTTVHKFGVDAS